MGPPHVGLRGGEGVCKYTLFCMQMRQCLEKRARGPTWGKGCIQMGPPHVGLRGGEGVCKYTLFCMQMRQCLEKRARGPTCGRGCVQIHPVFYANEAMP